ncbi:lysozyme inhibitor LprI family protein [Candidatus Viadribacter manganicus]|nr:lysozyme inhibitor LprI family protein [Candidatus Viadribacter manganicus]
MRKVMSTLFAVALLGGAITIASAQDRRGGRDRDDEFGPASAQELANADRRLNQVYQRRIADARADDRSDRRFRGWYSQEAALRASERAWITHRDAECQYLTQQDNGARGYDALVRGCLVEQINDRSEELREAEQVLAAR